MQNQKANSNFLANYYNEINGSSSVPAQSMNSQKLNAHYMNHNPDKEITR
jgi:hypothetical protein